MLSNNHPVAFMRLYTGVRVFALLFCFFTAQLNAQEGINTPHTMPLSFAKAIKLAQNNDPWLTGNMHQQRSITALSIAAQTLPDPKISLGLENLPTDGYAFDQENMTQAKISVSQIFPRGDIRELKSQQLKRQSEVFPYQRQDRNAQVAVIVGSLWLDTYRIQQSIALIADNRFLFEQLFEVAQASYASASGNTSQQDIVSAQLALTRLEDKLARLSQHKNRLEGQLSQWLMSFASDNELAENINYLWHNMKLSTDIPDIALLNPSLVSGAKWQPAQVLLPYLSSHPSLLAIDKKVSSSQAGIALAKQKYQPEWGVNASYGYRDDSPMGNSRADLFSVGVSFDLPLFTENRQDQEVQSAISQTEFVKTEKRLRLRKMLSNYASAKGRLLRLKERKWLYHSQLLPQVRDQAKASLTAYTNDEGNFSDVLRSRIEVLNANIDDLTLAVDEQKIHLELNYLFVGNIQLSSGNTMAFVPREQSKVKWRLNHE